MSSQKPGARRGADLLVETLKHAGVRHIFALSGNHIMSVFDALLGSGIEIIHTRHEAACVHMADAYARLTGDVGVALVTGGQGFSNAAAGLPTALAADSPVLLLSGDTPTTEVGRGSFQELDQVTMSGPVTKQSMRAETPDDLGNGIARAIRTALSGMPGPVHVALASNLLEAATKATVTESAARRAVTDPVVALAQGRAAAASIRGAKRPLLLAGPMFCGKAGRFSLELFERETRIPALLMESPRGLADPSLGAFAEVVAAADLIILAGKPLDFTLRFGTPAGISAAAALIVLDPELAMIKRARHARPERFAGEVHNDADSTVLSLAKELFNTGDVAWRDAVRGAANYRPPAWVSAKGRDGRLHPVELCRPIQSVIDRDPNTVFISDGGEIGQWAQAAIAARRRVINGVAGSIGASIPFALAARTVERDAPVIAVMGDGTFGFHMAEFDTAVRHNLPFVAVVGNDSAWNAEHQLQLRQFGPDRTHGCTLLPTRYDLVASALGGHGELVTTPDAMGPALARAIASGKPACVNVMIEGHAAPVIKRT
jgi:acetolactate synthase I/II/III large subunit